MKLIVTNGLISWSFLYISQIVLIWDFLVQLSLLSGTVHTGVEVRRMDPEISGLVERPLPRLLRMDLIFISLFHFILFFIFIFDLFSIFRTRFRVRVTKTTLSHSRSHQMTQSQVTWCKEGRRRFWKDDVI